MQPSVLFVNSALKPLLSFTLPESLPNRYLMCADISRPRSARGNREQGYLGIEPAFAAFLGTEPASPRALIVRAAGTGYRDSRAALDFVFISLSFCMLCFVYSVLTSLCPFCLLLGRSVFLRVLYYNLRVSEQTTCPGLL